MFEPFESKIDDEKLDELRQELSELFDTGKGGEERTFTHLPGITVLLMKNKRNKFFLLSIMPVSDDGVPLRRKAIYIATSDVFDSLKRVFNSPDIRKIIQTIEEINKTKRGNKYGDTF